MIPNPRFLPGQAVYIVNKQTLTVTQEKIESIHYILMDIEKNNYWEYLCHIEILEGEVLCANFAEVMEVLNG